jgi:tetratricopeptide (TPR) repeat protein
MAGRVEDFLRAAPKGREAGIEPSTLLDLLLLLPAEEHVGAADRLREALPEETWPIAKLADLYVSGGAPDRAVEVIVPALEAGPNEDLARLLVSADPDRAARVIGALCQGDGWGSELVGEVGRALVDASRPDLALPFLQDSLAREPMSYGVLMSLSGVDPELALAHVRRLTADFPDEAQSWQWRGQLELQAGNAAAAFEAYQAAGERALSTEVIYGLMRADPTRAYETALALTANTRDDEMLGAVAKVALKSDHPAECFATLQRAHDRDPSDHEWNWAMVVFDPETAAETLGASARRYQGDSRDEVVGAYANALLLSGHGAEAYDNYLEAHEQDPTDWEWQRGLARADPRRAVPILEERRKHDPNEADLAGALADAYAGSGRTEEALALYQEAVDKGGGAEWWARMGLVDARRARAGLQEAVANQPGSAEVWAALGEYHRLRGETDAARRAYGEARGLEPTVLVYEIRYRALSD